MLKNRKNIPFSKNPAFKEGFDLVAKSPSDLYHTDTKFLSYYNVSTKELTLVIYLKPPIYKPGSLLKLNKIQLLPIFFPNVSTTLTLEVKTETFIASNIQNTLTQVVDNLDDCDVFGQFYHCPLSGLRHKSSSDRCSLPLFEVVAKDLSAWCSFESIGI